MIILWWCNAPHLISRWNFSSENIFTIKVSSLAWMNVAYKRGVPLLTRFCIFIFRPFPARKWKRGMKSWERVLFNSWACAHHHGGVVAEGCRLSLGVMLLIRVSSVSRNGSSVSRHGESRTSIFSSLVSSL